ncbi:hypothetical protein [Nocardia gipuzkoensis]|uniref:hypothetical protein n=1 Tax=Nocardia gipuzkoensis TaxID=2749991 RepID=UPI00237D3E15|nr:hypothetical protein [Nocardia gipuzkoensis]MDE1672640.1 hypothetical protein [Nocardia gipuzkoensis]
MEDEIVDDGFSWTCNGCRTAFTGSWDEDSEQEIDLPAVSVYEGDGEEIHLCETCLAASGIHDPRHAEDFLRAISIRRPNA